MKRRMTRTVCACIALWFCLLAFSGCTSYHSQAGTLEELTGTYRLTRYLCKNEDGSDLDMLTRDSVEAYLIIGEAGGYYAYRDAETPLTWETAHIEYIHDDEEPDLYKAVKYTVGIADPKTQNMHPGYGAEPAMGFDRKQKTLNYHVPEYETQILHQTITLHSLTVLYTRVSDDVTPAYAAQALGAEVPALPLYALKAIHGQVMVFRAGEGSPLYEKYEYLLAVPDAVSMTATLYYREAGTQTDQSETVPFGFTPIEDPGRPLLAGTVSILGGEYLLSLNYTLAPLTFFSHEVNSEPDAEGTSVFLYSEYFEKYYGLSTEIHDIIREMTQE